MIYRLDRFHGGMSEGRWSRSLRFFVANLRCMIMREISQAYANDFYYLIFCYFWSCIIDVYPIAAKASCTHMACTQTINTELSSASLY